MQMKLIQIEQCQHNDPNAGSFNTRPFPFYPIRRLYHLLVKRGPETLITKVKTKWAARNRRIQPELSAADEVLGLQPGDWVQVKSEEEIAATLDNRGTCRGLAFVEEMHWYCGKTFRVYKRLERMFLEESKQYRKVRNTVLLEGIHCQGTGIDCDRACFLFWREAWLRRVPGPKEPGEL